MGKNKALLLPKTAKLLQTVGGQIKLARLRRGWTAQEIAEKAAKCIRPAGRHSFDSTR